MPGLKGQHPQKQNFKGHLQGNGAVPFVEMTGESSDAQKSPNEYTSAAQMNETKFDTTVDPNVRCAERFQG